ncbi:MAG: sigma-54 dependent transcriptional regulator [bacterium]
MVNKSDNKILVVDDNHDTLELISRNLKSRNYTVFTADNVNTAIDRLQSGDIDLVITDMKMPEIGGLDLTRHVKEHFPETEVIMITGYPSIDGAVEAVKIGAKEYITKPFTEEELFAAVEKVLTDLRIKKMRKPEDENEMPFEELLGKSKVMRKVGQMILKASSTIATVLIHGESGTGKEVVARAIHYNSPRSSHRFVPVNCGGIPEELLESELFGYLKGSFTGASETRAGFFQTADGGTIFLDEITEMSMSMQVKLLRVLQDKQAYMIGARKPQHINVRIIAATNKDIESMIRKNQFREDLYFRLNVMNIELPPLRERGDDIFLLISKFTEKYAEEMGKEIPEYSTKALKVLKNYYWPGNVRELENIIQRLIVMNEKKKIDISDLPSIMKYSAVDGRGGINRTLKEVELNHIKKVLDSVDWNKTRAAEILDIDRKTLRKKINESNIQEGR